MESASDDDPQTWSIDQVVHELCHNPQPRWSTSAAVQLIPDRESLADTFRQNHVDGDTLLALDMGTLKDDLGISSFGQKRAIMKAIEFLRLHSQRYQLAVLQAGSIARLQSPVYSTPQIPHSMLSVSAQSPAIPGLGITQALETRQTFSPSFSSPGGHSHLFQQQQVLPQAEFPFHKPQVLTHIPTPSTDPKDADTPPDPGPAVGVLGSLDLLQASVDAELSRNAQVIKESSTSVALVKDDLPARIKPTKKIAPTLVSQLESPTDKHSYLSNEPRLPKDTFYHCISTDWEDSLCRLPDDDAINFYIENQCFPSGRRQIIAAQMKHYLQEPVKIFPKSGWLFRIPYGAKHSIKGLKNTSGKSLEQLFTIFPGNGSRPVVRALTDFPELTDTMQRKSLREASTFMPPTSSMIMTKASVKQSTGSQVEQETSSHGEFAYLLAKYPPREEDDVLPLYGDSGDEGELDEETWKEYEEERTAKPNDSSHMTADEVESTINETLEDYRHEWRQTKLPKVQLKAYRLWMVSARQKSRKAALEHSQFWRDRSTNQLRKLKEALLKDVWHKPADVRHQCQSMELTTFSIEENAYFVQALLSDEPPVRPTRAECQKKLVKRQPPPEDGEELIESDSAASDDLEDFLDDNSDVGSIHHEPDQEEWSPVIPKKEVISPSVKKDVSQDSVEPTLPTTAIDDVNDNDADIETDSSDAIVTPSSRRRAQTGKILSPRKLNGKEQATPKKMFTLLPLQSRARELENTDSDSDVNPELQLPTSKYHLAGDSRISAIDLTMSSPASNEKRGKETSSDFDVHTPDLNPGLDNTPSRQMSRRSSSQSRTSSSYNSVDSGLPPWSDFEGMRRAPWDIIVCLSDGRRGLAKAVYDLQLSMAIKLSKLIEPIFLDNAKNDGRDLIVHGLTCLAQDGESASGIGIELDHRTITLALLYMTYCDGQNYFDTDGPSEANIQNAYKCLDAGYRLFFELLKQLLQIAIDKLSQQEATIQTRKKRKRESMSGSNLLLSDTDLQMSDGFNTDPAEQQPPPSSNKKRKRAVAESQEASLQQKSDQQRIEDQEKRRKVAEQRLAQMATNGDVVRPVNFSEPYVYLDPHIASRVKDHQLKGIQFMWREIIEDPKQQGCILAHTMGLGKTMQVISLLVTIAQCSQSRNPKMLEHIPIPARRGRTLILCPASLLDNWYDELMMWSPSREILGNIYKLDFPNHHAVRTWAKRGGILLVSYDRFRNLVNANPSLERLLLEEPSLVVADEAHKMKNAKSSLTKLAQKFKTTSRVALTGSPLNNHLDEYHTMVDWIAPGYLGNMVQFKAKYSEPIREGLYADSTPFERRLALRKLHVLKRDLAPKINRADISAIEQDMPSKTEYFITIAVTDLQKEVYNTYVDHMTQAMFSGRGGHARLWGWIAILQLLCNHPFCCFEKLKARQRNLLETQAQLADEMATDKEPENDRSSPEKELEGDKDDPKEAPPGDVIIDTRGPMQEAMEKVLEVFESTTAAGDLEDTALSYRTSLVRDIVKGAMAVGDKTLIFSHSIPTLGYLERMLTKLKCNWTRLDGKTKVSDRHAMTKEFNKDASYQVFLISMRAGGLGMNLQGANRVIIFDFSYNPSWEEQAIGRAYRLGQTRPVFVYRFRAGSTFEEVMFNKSVFKQQMFQRVVDHKNPMRHASKDITEWFFTVKDTEQKEFDECIGKDPKVLDRIIKRVEYIRNIELTETFQREDDEKLNEEDVKQAEAEFQDERLLRENPDAWRAKQQQVYQQQSAQQQQALRLASLARTLYSPNIPNPPVQSPHFRNTQTPSRINDSTLASTFGISNSGLPPMPVNRSDMNIPMAMTPLPQEITQRFEMQRPEHSIDDQVEQVSRSGPQSPARAMESGNKMS